MSAEMTMSTLLPIGFVACTVGWACAVGLAALLVSMSARADERKNKAESHHRLITQEIPKLSDRLYVLADQVSNLRDFVAIKMDKIDQRLEEVNNQLAGTAPVKKRSKK